MTARVIDIQAARARPRQWYIVNTHTKREREARFHLERSGFDVYLPMRRLEGPVVKGHVPARPLFPSYLFVRVDARAAAWWEIHSSIGVKALIFSGGKPAPFDGELLDRIRAREVDGLVDVTPPPEPAAECHFKEGDAVKVALQGRDETDILLDAIFQERVDANRVAVLLTLIGSASRKRTILRLGQVHDPKPK